jgi:hypothetical protein
MPLIYRSMKRSEDDLPLVGNRSNELGVRVAPGRVEGDQGSSRPERGSWDVHLDEDSHVLPQSGGMSVNDHWRHMLGHLIPKRLRPRFPGASGSNALSCFRHGDGAFQAEPINERLDLALKDHNPRGGLVVPKNAIHIDDFQRDLAATRSAWVVAEDD